MTEKAETSDVGSGADPHRGHGPGRSFVELGHHLDRGTADIIAHVALLDGSSDDARTERLGENQQITGLRSGVSDETVGLDGPVTANPYFGSGSSMEWPPTIVQPASSMTLAPPAMTFFKQIERQRVARPSNELESGHGCAAHCVDIRRGRWLLRCGPSRMDRLPPG